MANQDPMTQGATSKDWPEEADGIQFRPTGEMRITAATYMPMAKFSAVLPSVATAIRVHGDSGARVTFDIDDSFMEQVKTLIDWRNELLEVTVRPVPK